MLKKYGEGLLEKELAYSRAYRAWDAASYSAKISTEYNKLRDLITETYEKNYNKKSDDCLEVLGEVFCD